VGARTDFKDDIYFG